MFIGGVSMKLGRNAPKLPVGTRLEGVPPTSRGVLVQFRRSAPKSLVAVEAILCYNGRSREAKMAIPVKWGFPEGLKLMTSSERAKAFVGGYSTYAMKLTAFPALVLAWVPLLLAPTAHAGPVLGSANSYAVLAASTVTNVTTSATTITGDLGVYAGSTCTGFVGCPTTGAGTVSGTINLANGASQTAVADSNTAYNDLAATTPTTDEGTASLGTGGLASLAPGVYEFTGSVTNLIGTLTLAGDGNSNDLWIFQFAASDALTTATGSSVVVTNTGVNAGVYFEVGSQATLGNDTTFQGNILAGTSIVFDPGAQITCGRAFAQTAEVTFAGVNDGMNNEVDSSNCSAISSTGFNGGQIENGTVVASAAVGTPEPSTLLLLGAGLLVLMPVVRRKIAS